MSAKFFFVFAGDNPDGITCAVYHDEPPSRSMLKALPRVLFKYRLEGKWAEMSLDELMDEYLHRCAAGTLPPTNMIPPPPPKKDGPRRVDFETRKREIAELVARRNRARALVPQG